MSGLRNADTQTRRVPTQSRETSTRKVYEKKLRQLLVSTPCAPPKKNRPGELSRARDDDGSEGPRSPHMWEFSKSFSLQSIAFFLQEIDIVQTCCKSIRHQMQSTEEPQRESLLQSEQGSWRQEPGSVSNALDARCAWHLHYRDICLHNYGKQVTLWLSALEAGCPTTPSITHCGHDKLYRGKSLDFPHRVPVETQPECARTGRIYVTDNKQTITDTLFPGSDPGPRPPSSINSPSTFKPIAHQVQTKSGAPREEGKESQAVESPPPNASSNDQQKSNYRVYAAGGMGLDLRPHNHLQHYDMLKDMWVSLAHMPTPRYAATSFLRGSKIYVLGGRQSKYAVNAFEVFDIETRSWTKFPNIPCKRAFSSFVTLDDRLYSLGGLRQGRLYRQPKFLRTMDVFDMEQGGWLKMERSFFLKKRRADFVAGSLSGRVIVAGGLGNQPTVLETAEAFHPGKSRWEALPAMPTPRCACSSLVLRNCLLAVGGVNQGLSDAVEALCVSDA
ncbi:hypothetical protein JEQ12_003502 [Ovis aries]|uniref:Kelch domain-containing protein 8A n=1 Tax=Ovis aries TaxID=9940 RepID=A0A836CWX9_SHEEP|nr:hypothetical protein JEQ12_003502 [Ovis aries]